MPRLSNQQWTEARAGWEADPRPGFDWLSSSLGVSRQAVSKMAAKQGWTKVAQLSGQVAQPEEKVAQPKPTQKASPKPSEKARQGPADPPPEEGAGVPMSPVTPSLPHPTWQLVETTRRLGRPTQYRDEFVPMLIEFFDIEVQKFEQIEVPDGKGGFHIEQKVIINTFPTLTRFAAKIGVTRETLHNWATAKNKDGSLRYPDFSYAYARARDAQESLIIEGGMAGLYESRFASLAAKNLAGWRERMEQEIEQSATITPKEELDRVYARAIAAAKAGREAVMGRGERLLAKKG